MINEEKKEKQLESAKKWRLANPEKWKAARDKASKKWRLENPQKYKAKQAKASKKWRAANHEKYKVSRDKASEKWRVGNKSQVNANLTAWRKANPEKARAIRTRYRLKNPKKFLTWARAHYYRHRTKRLEQSRNYYQQKSGEPSWLNKRREWARLYAERKREMNPDQVKANKRSWCAKHSEKLKVVAGKYRAQRRAVPVNDFTPEQWNEVKQEGKFQCYYCADRPTALEQEHKLPLIKGGSNTKANIVPACLRCNRSKQDQPWPRWLTKLGITERITAYDLRELIIQTAGGMNPQYLE